MSANNLTFDVNGKVTNNKLKYKTSTTQYPFILIYTNDFHGLIYKNTCEIENKNITALGYIYPTTISTSIGNLYYSRV